MTHVISAPVEALPNDEPQFAGSRQLFRHAALEFGVRLTPEEDQDWKYLLSGAAIVDHLIDVERVDVAPHIEAIAAGDFRDDLSERLQTDVRTFVTTQPDRFPAILDEVQFAERLATRQRQATSPHTLVEIRLAEAAILARLLSLRVGDGYDAIPRGRFNEWLLHFDRAGYLVDSLADMRTDYRTGESGVRPTARAHAVVAKAACKETVAALRKTPPSVIGKCAVNGFKYIVLGNKMPATAE